MCEAGAVSHSPGSLLGVTLFETHYESVELVVQWRVGVEQPGGVAEQ